MIDGRSSPRRVDRQIESPFSALNSELQIAAYDSEGEFVVVYSSNDN